MGNVNEPSAHELAHKIRGDQAKKILKMILLKRHFNLLPSSEIQKLFNDFALERFGLQAVVEHLYHILPGIMNYYSNDPRYFHFHFTRYHAFYESPEFIVNLAKTDRSNLAKGSIRIFMDMDDIYRQMRYSFVEEVLQLAGDGGNNDVKALKKQYVPPAKKGYHVILDDPYERLKSISGVETQSVELNYHYLGDASHVVPVLSPKYTFCIQGDICLKQIFTFLCADLKIFQTIPADDQYENYFSVYAIFEKIADFFDLNGNEGKMYFVDVKVIESFKKELERLFKPLMKLKPISDKDEKKKTEKYVSNPSDVIKAIREHHKFATQFDAVDPIAMVLHSEEKRMPILRSVQQQFMLDQELTLLIAAVAEFPKLARVLHNHRFCHKFHSNCLLLWSFPEKIDKSELCKKREIDDKTWKYCVGLAKKQRAEHSEKWAVLEKFKNNREPNQKKDDKEVEIAMEKLKVEKNQEKTVAEVQAELQKENEKIRDLTKNLKEVQKKNKEIARDLKNLNRKHEEHTTKVQMLDTACLKVRGRNRDIVRTNTRSDEIIREFNLQIKKLDVLKKQEDLKKILESGELLKKAKEGYDEFVEKKPTNRAVKKAQEKLEKFESDLEDMTEFIDQRILDILEVKNAEDFGNMTLIGDLPSVPVF